MNLLEKIKKLCCDFLKREYHNKHKMLLKGDIKQIPYLHFILSVMKAIRCKEDALIGFKIKKLEKMQERSKESMRLK